MAALVILADGLCLLLNLLCMLDEDTMSILFIQQPLVVDLMSTSCASAQQ